MDHWLFNGDILCGGTGTFLDCIRTLSGESTCVVDATGAKRGLPSSSIDIAESADCVASVSVLSCCVVVTSILMFSAIVVSWTSVSNASSWARASGARIKAVGAGILSLVCSGHSLGVFTPVRCLSPHKPNFSTNIPTILSRSCTLRSRMYPDPLSGLRGDW